MQRVCVEVLIWENDVMKRIWIFLAAVLLCFSCSSSAEARYTYKIIEPMCYEEPQKIRCTCYFEHGRTATGQKTRYGLVAGKKEWLGYICEINEVNEDGSVGPLIGIFEFADTGAGMDSDGDGKGDTIKNGTSIDVWVDSKTKAYDWVGTYGDYVYIKIIKAKG